jgi:hypothetical protein
MGTGSCYAVLRCWPVKRWRAFWRPFNRPRKSGWRWYEPQGKRQPTRTTGMQDSGTGRLLRCESWWQSGHRGPRCPGSAESEGTMLRSRDEEITSLFRAGHSQHAIARATGLSQPGIRKALNRLGLLKPQNQSDNRQHSQPLPADNHPPAPQGEERDNPSEIQQAPSRATRTDLTIAAPEQEQGREADNRPPPVIPSGALCCAWCQGWFMPRRPGGQTYCCNICGHKGAGIQPAVPDPHTAACTLIG